MNVDRWTEKMMGVDFTIPDPGDGEAIVVGRYSHCLVLIDTGASGETNTLAAPLRMGQELTMVCRSHGGGDRVITAAADINANGDNVMTFGAATDVIRLLGIPSDSDNTLVWRVIANDGVALA